MSNRTTDLEKKSTEHTSKVLKPTNPLNERNERKRETKVKPESLRGAVHVDIWGCHIVHIEN